MNIQKKTIKSTNFSKFAGKYFIHAQFLKLGFNNYLFMFYTMCTVMYISGLILLDKYQTIDGIARAFGCVSNDTLAKALLFFRIIDNSFFINMVKAIQSKTSNAGYLIIDDVTIVKTGKKFSTCGRIYDTTNKKYATGFMLVVAVWTNGKVLIPVACKIWKCREVTGGEQYKTKIELAHEILNYVYNNGLALDYVTFDSWYSGKNTLKLLRQKYNYHFITRIKHNRYVWYNGSRLKVSGVDELFSRNSFRYYRSVELYLKSACVLLPGFGELNLCMVHRKKHFRGTDNRYIISSLPLSNCEMIRCYSSRWAIEVFFRDMKQLFGLSKFQFRKEKMISAHILFSFIGYVIVQDIKLSEKYKTMGCAVRYLQGIVKYVDEHGKVFLIDTSSFCDREIVDRTTIWKKIST